MKPKLLLFLVIFLGLTGGGYGQRPILVKDINPGTSGSSIGAKIVLNGVMLFQATDGKVGSELWRSDGTEAGTKLVKDINSGSNGSSISNMTIFNGAILFQATDAKTGAELWKSDGTEAGTTLVKDINPGSNGSSISLDEPYYRQFKDKFYFLADNGVNGRELWRTDGTTAGTALFFESIKGATESGISNLIEYNNELYFTAKTATGTGIHKTDGTTVTLVKEYPSIDSRFVIANNLLFFLAEETATGSELYKSDGTANGTTIVKDLTPGKEPSPISTLLPVGNKLAFDLSGTTKRKLMITDGSASGTIELNDSTGLGRGSVVINNKFYHSDDSALWESDGTVGGSRKIATLSANYTLDQMKVYKNKLYYTTKLPTKDNLLWVFDPATSRTEEIKDDIRFGIMVFFDGGGKYFFWYSVYNSGLVRYTDGTNVTDLYAVDPGGAVTGIELGDYFMTGPASTNDRSATGDELYKILLSDPSSKCQTFKGSVTNSTGLSSDEVPIPCVAGVVSLSATATGGALPYTYEWKRNGEAIGTASAPLSTTAIGDYTAFFSDANGCKYTSNTVHLVSDKPVIDIIGTRFFCSGQTTTLTVSVIGKNTPFTYKWRSGNTDVGTTENLVVSKGGAYSVTVTDIKGCQVSATTQVTENVNLPISIGGSDGFCPGQATSLTANVSSGSGSYTYQWRQNGSDITGATSRTLTASTAGVYSVSVVDSKSCTGISNNLTVSQKPLPTATITVIGGVTQLTPGGSLTLTTPAASGQTYQWFRAGTAIAGAVSNTYSATLIGDYTVTVTRDGCSATSAAMGIESSFAASIAGSNLICAGQSTTLTATVLGGTGAITYQWRQGTSVISGATSNTYVATVAGTYSVSATTSGGLSATATTTVTQKPSPIASISAIGGITLLSQGGSLTLSASTATGQTYQWFNGNQLIAGATTSTYVVSQPGSYSVTVTLNGCSATSTALEITVLTTLEPGPTGIGMEISPNPASDFCTVRLLLDNASLAQVSLLNAGGKPVRVWASGRSARSHETVLSLVDLPAGLYFVQAIANDRKVVMKLIRQ